MNPTLNDLDKDRGDLIADVERWTDTAIDAEAQVLRLEARLKVTNAMYLASALLYHRRVHGYTSNWDECDDQDCENARRHEALNQAALNVGPRAAGSPDHPEDREPASESRVGPTGADQRGPDGHGAGVATLSGEPQAPAASLVDVLRKHAKSVRIGPSTATGQATRPGGEL